MTKRTTIEAQTRVRIVSSDDGKGAYRRRTSDGPRAATGKGKGAGKQTPKGKVETKAVADDKAKQKTQAFYVRMYKCMLAVLNVPVELVTPEMAAKYLATTVKNRKPVKSAVNQYAVSILGCLWGFNPQPIIFSDKGNLMDGRHRMLAIIASGIAIPLVVIRGVPASSFDVVDGGTSRSLKQVMKMENIPMADAVASIVRTVIVYESMNYTKLSHAGGVCNREALLFYHNHTDEVIRAAEWGVKIKEGKHGTLGAGGFLAYILFAIAPKKAAEFLEGIATGANLPTGSPILRYRNKYAALRAQATVHRNTQVDMMFEAWNEWNGHEVKRMKMAIPYGLDITAKSVAGDPRAKF